jgi:polyisoprenyl-teichoic acid--peptidoglycan teichoic acid transferase
MNRTRSCFITVLSLFIVVCLSLLCIFIVNSNFKREGGSGASGSFFGSRDLLFLGLDEREESNEFVGRTDTIIIFHISSGMGNNSLISIPRDTRVYLEGKGWNKINAAYVYGGTDMIHYEIKELTGIDVDRTMILNFRCFKKIIDVLGGINIKVEEPLHDPLSGADFEPGEYLMDGEQALSFARCRSTARADLDRVDRQKYLLSQIMEQKMNIPTIMKILNPFNDASDIFKVLAEETRSDFTLWDFCSIGFVLLFSNKGIDMVTIPTSPATIEGISYLIVDEKEVKEFLKDYLK